MAQIVRYVASNQNRQRRRDRLRVPVETQAEVRAAPTDLPEVPIDTHGRLRGEQNAFDDCVVRALKSVEPTARACLLLRTVEGLSFKEVSALLEIPEGTAMSHVFRARAAVSKALADERRADEGDASSLRAASATAADATPIITTRTGAIGTRPSSSTPTPPSANQSSRPSSDRPA
jgi:DNA-directed RNA polymerase specialized sigma24 family protein